MTPAAAAPTTVTCGSTLTTDTVLTSDLNCPTGVALNIGASGITLDLGGHTLSGAGLGVQDSSFGAPFIGVTIRNGTIAGFGTGIYLAVTQNTTISHVRLINDAAGLSGMFQGAIVAQIASYGIHVDHSRINTSGRAIFTQGGDITVDHTAITGGAGLLLTEDNATLEHDALTDTSLRISEGGSLTIADSVMIRSPLDTGFEAFGTTTISHNLIAGANLGLDVEYPSGPYVIAGNVFRNDTIGVLDSIFFGFPNTSITGNRFVGDGAAGILMQTTGTNTRPVVISGNTFTRDGFHSGGMTDSAGHPVMDGLHVNVQAGSDITVSDNTTRFNAAYGIWAEPGTVVDGGGNTSTGNPDGCLGVTCS